MQIGIKLDVYTQGMDSPFSTSTWLTYGINNPSSAFRSAIIEREVNCSELKATIVLKTMRDERGKSWADDIQLMDVVVFTVKTATNEEVQQRVKFFGFIVDISEKEVVEVSRGEASVILTCSSMPFFVWPLLAFDRASDPMADALKIKKRLFEQLDPQQGRPHDIMQRLIENVFNELIKPIMFKNNSISDYLHYSLSSCADILPFVYRTVNSAIDGFTDDFWSAFSVLAEIYGPTGWLHELYLDILDDDEIEALKGQIVGAGIPIPSDMSKSLYLTLVMRENPLPVLTADAPSLNEQQIIKLKDAKATLDTSRWDNLKVFELDCNAISFIKNRNASNMRTVFTMDMMIDPTKSWFWDVPTVVDTAGYIRFGYSNLNILTNYARAISYNEGSPSDGDKLNTIKNLFSLGLRNASYNSCMDIYKQGTLIIPLKIDLTLGNLYFLPHEITGYEDATYYIHKIVDSINCEGISTSTLTLTRGMTDQNRSKLEENLLNRLTLTKTVNMQSRVDNLPDPVKLGYLRGVAQK